MEHLLSIEEIMNNSEQCIEWMCYDVLITTDNQVFNLQMKPLKEQLIGGSYCFRCNGKYRTWKWIKENRSNVLGAIECF